ncbi:MAG TPA: ATP-binding cassette domain-containing protein [Streptosporangiaceae bacterium]
MTNPTPPAPAPVIEARGLTKRFGSLRAVDDLTFTVRPGGVTGFLGPNGAGKTTTLRMLLGLVRPTSGTGLIGGRTYAGLPDPLRTVGAALEASGFHPGRSARDHLRALAATAAIPDSRVDEVLGHVGLHDVADRRTLTYSMGMRQRLALAAALLGDPPVLVLDEPANGLDPEGIAWLRDFLRRYAAMGRTVLISSHVLSEVAQTVDEVLIIAHGRLVRQAPLSELTGGGRVRVRTPDGARLTKLLLADGVRIDMPSEDTLYVTGAETAKIGHAAHANGIELHELVREESDLERVFLRLTGGAE